MGIKKRSPSRAGRGPPVLLGAQTVTPEHFTKVVLDPCAILNLNNEIETGAVIELGH